jgi:hypothetical protein
MRKSLSLLLLATLPLLALPACSSSGNGMTPSSLNGKAAAASVATLASPDVPIFEVGSASTSAAFTGDSSGGGPAGPGPCQFGDSTGQFSCPDSRKGPLSLTRKLIFRDAAGNVQSSFDKATTESIEIQTSADGTISRPGGGTVTIHRTGDMTTSGLSGEATTHTLNGTEQGTVDAAWTLPDGTNATENTTIADTTNNLVVPIPAKPAGQGPGSGTGPNMPSSARPFPLSGSRTHTTSTTSMHGTDTKTTSSSRTETFDGTGIVQVVMTVNGQTKTCTVDLTNHTNTCGK